MKTRIMTAACALMACMAAQAQMPKVVGYDITLDEKDENGEDKVVRVEQIEEISMDFYGSPGTADDPVTKQPVKEANMDLRAYLMENGVDRATISVVHRMPGATMAFLVMGTGPGEMNAIVELTRTGYYYDEKTGWSGKQYDFVVPKLGYMTKYYIRPAAVVPTETGNMTIFGTQKSFTTLRTIDAALANEPIFGAWRACVENELIDNTRTCLVLTEEALLAITGLSEVPEIVQNDTKYKGDNYPLSRTVCEYLRSDKAMFYRLSDAATPIACADGKLSAITDVPADIAKGFLPWVEQQYPMVKLNEQRVNYATNSEGKYLYTTGTGSLKQLSGTWDDGTAYDYLEALPELSTSRPYVAFDLPHIPTGTYKLELTLENGTDTVGTRFQTYMYESTEIDAYKLNNGTRLTPPEGAATSDGNYFATTAGQHTVTVDMGTFTFSGDKAYMIQFRNGVTTAQMSRGLYTRAMRFCHLTLTRVEDQPGGE